MKSLNEFSKKKKKKKNASPNIVRLVAPITTTADVLALDHPDTERAWTRDATWQRVETETRSLLAQARPVDMADALVRHLAVGAFLQLRREDQIVDGPEGELHYRHAVELERLNRKHLNA